jgi:hypothetical protein
MTVSQPIEEPTNTHRFRWLATRSDRTYNQFFDSHFLATSVLAPGMQTATSQTHPHPRVATNQLPFPRRTELYRSRLTAKSP